MSFLPNNNRANTDEDRYAAREILKAAAGVAERRDPTEPETAAIELLNAGNAVKREMQEAALRGELRTNSQAPSWTRYEKARQAWDELAVTLASGGDAIATSQSLYFELMNKIADALPETRVQSTLRSRIRFMLEEIQRLRAIDRRGTGAEPTADAVARVQEVLDSCDAQNAEAIVQAVWQDGPEIDRLIAQAAAELGYGSPPPGSPAVTDTLSARRVLRAYFDRCAGALRAGGPPEEEA